MALASRWTAVSTRKSFVLVRRDGAYRQAIVERRRCVHEVGGVIGCRDSREFALDSAIGLDGLILPGWKPEFDPRQVHADCDNVPQMLDALQIDGIVPAEVSVFGAFPNVKAAMEKRLRSLTHPRWIDAVTTLIYRKLCT
jgi:hypothetical protein